MADGTDLIPAMDDLVVRDPTEGYLPSIPLDPEDNPYEQGVGRPLEHSMEHYERGLWEIAMAGGNVEKALRALAAQGYQDYSARSMRRWITGRFRNRYHAICMGTVSQLERRRAMAADTLATRLGDAEEEAIRQVVSRLSNTDAVEASVVLRNLSQSKKIQEDTSAAIRGTSAAHVAARSLGDIAAQLARMGLADLIEPDDEDEFDDEPITDAEVVGEGSPTTPATDQAATGSATSGAQP